MKEYKRIDIGHEDLTEEDVNTLAKEGWELMSPLPVMGYFNGWGTYNKFYWFSRDIKNVN